MKKIHRIVETEIDTGINLKPPRMQERFLKGPIPLRLLSRAAKLSGSCLGVYLAVHHRTALTRSSKVTLPKALLEQMGVSRDAKARALKLLEKDGLVAVENKKGRASRVALAYSPAAEMQKASNDQWEVVEDGMRCKQQEYFIPANQLMELRDPDLGIAMWPIQMAAKSWVDIEAFIGAFAAALATHKPPGIDKVNLEKTYEQARHLARSRL